MIQSVAELTDLFTRPVDQIPDALVANGLLPETKTIQPVPVEALNVAGVGPVFAHIDPRRPHVDNRADVFAVLPFFLSTGAVTPVLSMEKITDSSPSLFINIIRLGSNRPCLASVDLQVFPTSIRITATNNPVTMTLTNAATDNRRVTVQVPFTSTQAGIASIFIRLTSENDGGFDWFGADVRRV